MRTHTLRTQGVMRAQLASIVLGCGPTRRACLQGRVAVLQSLSGTGSLRVGAAFIKAWLPGKDIYISNPTWGNHRNIFSDAGLEWKYYRCCLLTCKRASCMSFC